MTSPKDGRETPEDPAAIATGMTLADISIRNHVFAWILMVALIGFGILCYTGFGDVFRGLGVSQNPDVDFPIVSVSISWEGASPEIMETDVVDVLEDACSTVEGVLQMSSTARQGGANLTLEFGIGRDIDAALQDVQTKVSEAARHLPREIDPPTISKTNPEDQPIIRLALFGDRAPTFLADYVRNVIKPQLQMIAGIGEVHVMGYRDRNVRVWYDASRLEAQGLTVLDVNRAIQREHQEVPAGRIEGKEREMNVRAQGEAIDLSSFSNLVVTYVNGAPVRLKDVAVVEDGLEDRRRLNRAMGESSIGFGITKMRGANAVQVGRDVKTRIEALKRQLPEGLRLEVNWDTTVFIERSINEILFTLVLAALLTGLVCWLFLGSWSTTVNVLLAIPTSILGTFIVIYVFGFTLNTYTVLGLTLVVGIVVDDAIMVLENIYRHREMGEGKVTAASAGAREITFAAAATTLAIVSIFLPVAFMKGIIGKFFFQFGVTISVAVVLSLLEALTLAPMRCSRFLEVEHRGRLGRTMDRLFQNLSRLYLRALGPALRHRAWLLGGSLGFFLLSLGTIAFLRQEFIPSQDMSRFTIRFQTPVGTSLDATDRYFRQIESFLTSRPEVTLFAGNVGGSDVNAGQAYVNMKPPRDRPIDAKVGRRLTQLEFMDVVRRHAATIPGGRIVLQDISQTGFSASRGGGFPVEFNVRGRDWNVLAVSARKIAEEMRQSGLVSDVDTDYQVGMPEAQVVPDRDRAADLGVSMASIGETVNAAIGGVRVAKFKDKGRRFDIRARLLQDQRRRPEDMGRLLVTNRERRSRPAGPADPDPAGADAAGHHPPRPRAGHLDLCERRDRRLTGRRRRALAGHRPRGPSRRLPRRAGGEHEGLSRVVRLSVVRLRARHPDRLHGPGLAVQFLLAPGHRPARTPLLHQRSAFRAVARGPELERLQPARADPAGRDREEELDHAGRLHEPGPAPGRPVSRGPARGLPDPAAPHPHDVDRHDRRRPAARDGHRRRRGASAADGPRARGRHGPLDTAHALRRSCRLQRR